MRHDLQRFRVVELLVRRTLRIVTALAGLFLDVPETVGSGLGRIAHDRDSLVGTPRAMAGLAADPVLDLVGRGLPGGRQSGSRHVTLQTGFRLLRVVDPRLKTKTLEDFGLAYIFISVAEIVMLVTVPALVAKGVILVPALVLIGGFFACIFLSRRTVGWFRQPLHELREHEKEIIAEATTATG